MIKLLFLSTIYLLTRSWWQVGHVLTAKIAEIKLKQLDQNVYSKFSNLTTSINRLCDQRSQTMIQSASWPDDIKQAAYGMNIWNDWHFIDTPYVGDSTIPVINYTIVLSNSINVALLAKKTISLNKQSNSAQRALFARYLIHLAGDIHQPLHSVALFNKTYPKGDLGGNSERVILLNGTSMNFHSYWDSGAFQFQNQTWFIKRPLNDNNRSAIQNRAQQLLNNYENELTLQGKNTDPYHWAQQSFRFAQNTTYPHILKSNKITQQYNDLVYKTAQKRVVLAGLRLANTVIQIFSDGYKVEQSDQQVEKRIKSMISRVKPLIIDESL